MIDPDLELLDRALDAWRTSFDPRLELGIVRLGRQIARTRPAIEAALDNDGERVSIDRSGSGGPRSVAEGGRGVLIEQHWHAVASSADAGDVDRLLDVVWGTDAKRMGLRVAALARRPPDPRVGRKLAIVARVFPSRHGAELLEALRVEVARSGTPACLPDLVAAAAGRGDNMRVPFERARDAILERRPLGEAGAALVAELSARVGDAQELAALWADHHADPQDLARRLVLADALVQVGDPRGELIVHQCGTAEGSLDRRLVARARRALAIHIDEWVGPLPNIDRRTVRFERGFPVAMACGAGRGDLAVAIDRPEWDTLEELALASPPDRLGDLIRRLRGLHRLELGDHPEAVPGGPYPTIRTAVRRRRWLAPKRTFPNLRVLASAWPGAVAAANRHAHDLGLDVLVHLGGSQLGEFARERYAAPRETRFVEERALFIPLGWYGRMWRGRTNAELVWAGRSKNHGSIVALVSALVANGVREIAFGATAIRAPREERELERVIAEYRAVAWSRTARPFDPFASEP